MLLVVVVVRERLALRRLLLRLRPGELLAVDCHAKGCGEAVRVAKLRQRRGWAVAMVQVGPAMVVRLI